MEKFKQKRREYLGLMVSEVGQDRISYIFKVIFSFGGWELFF